MSEKLPTVRHVIEVATYANGDLLWVEKYLPRNKPSIGQTFVVDYIEYRVIGSSFTQGQHGAALLEHVVEIVGSTRKLTLKPEAPNPQKFT